MSNIKENGMLFLGEIGLSAAHRSFGKWLLKKSKNLSNQIKIFSRELAREHDAVEKNKLKKWIHESKAELRKLYYSWTHSEMRKLLLEKGYSSFVMRQDNLLHKANVEKRYSGSDIERGYRLAGHIIERCRKGA